MRPYTTLNLSAALCVAALGLPAQAGTWGVTRSLDGPFAVSSPPDAPQVAVSASGHALLAWNATGSVRYADKPRGGAWSRSQSLPGGATAAGTPALALGSNGVAALAWTTVATRYTPSELRVSVRGPGTAFGAPVTVVADGSAGEVRLGVACDGTVTLVWSSPLGLMASERAGQPGTGACDGTPGAGAWAPAQRVSTPGVAAALPDLRVNDTGTALLVWQEGAPGQPTAVAAALRPAGGGWEAPQTVSAPTGLPTWNPKPGLDVVGNAVVGYLDGTSMVVARRPAGGEWGTPQKVSGTQNVYYPALAMSARGDVLVAWLALDANNGGSVWHSLAPAGGGWPAPARLSAASESADWPTAAFAADGSLAVVGWVDDTANLARAAVRTGGAWRRSTLGGGWWGGQVPVGAGNGSAAAGWAAPTAGNPNAVTLFGRSWQ